MPFSINPSQLIRSQVRSQASGKKNIVLEGEGVIQRYGNKNFIISPNIQTCVVVTMYNRKDQTGAVIHFNHNIPKWIKKNLSTALGKVRGDLKKDEIEIMDFRLEKKKS